MNIVSHILGFSRIGVNRELKKATEAYWAGEMDQAALLKVGESLRQQHWAWQKDAGLDYVSVGDFAWYDHVLTTSLMLGNVPPRHQNKDGKIDLDTLFRIARGRAPTGQATTASEMVKWFDTNYHYIVPEFHQNQTFKLRWRQLFDEIDEAIALGHQVKPVLLGPISYLWLGKEKDAGFNRLSLLDNLIEVYQAIFEKLDRRGIEWVQMDEPALVMDLPEDWQAAYKKAYAQFGTRAKLMLTTYFGTVDHHINLIKEVKVDGLHLDMFGKTVDLEKWSAALPKEWVLSLGVVNGRNVWRADLQASFERIRSISTQRDIWVGSSCSLLHCPINLETETGLDNEVKSWLAYAVQKCQEIALLAKAVKQDAPISELAAYSQPIYQRQQSSRVHDAKVKEAISKINASMTNRKSVYAKRKTIQQSRFGLPLLPTTTIGSFPQTAEIRLARQQFKQRKIDQASYEIQMKSQIAYAICQQEKIGLDVLVHGEAERNDMVEYFGEQLTGFVFTKNGWVQSFGTRCVKPPIIVGDVSRPQDMTVFWSTYAQSLTQKPVKGMLTGPVTILCWSFEREDMDKESMCKQIALALREEVGALEKAGISMIQIDEPALREGLPLRKPDWASYLKWAVESFKVASSGVSDGTQIHTHMCYSEFNDIIADIADMDADVITIETSRSDMKLLKAFKDFHYPNDIGPGVYDIHSPNVPTVESMMNLLEKAAENIPVEQLWVNPDCGLKTRGWAETTQALSNMVTAAKMLREKTLSNR